MKTYKHQEIISTNGFDMANLSKPVRGKVKAFSRMEKKMPDLVDADRTKLSRKLKALDNEIYKDIIDELDETLENNERDIELSELQRAERNTYTKLTKWLADILAILRYEKTEAHSSSKGGMKAGFSFPGERGGEGSMDIVFEHPDVAKWQVTFQIQIDEDDKKVRVQNRVMPKVYQSMFAENEPSLKATGDMERRYYWAISLSAVLDYLLDLGHFMTKEDLSAAGPKLKGTAGDEAILEALWKAGYTSGLTKSFLESKGVRADLGRKSIGVGRFHLSRDSWFKVSFALRKV